jgi:hypothetical protein
MNFPEKSMDALVIEAEVMAAFRAHMKASSKQKQLTTTRLIQPSQHLTGPCWRDFSKYVKTFAGWTAKRVVAHNGSGIGAFKKTYYIDATYRPPKTPKTQKAQKAQKTQKTQKAPGAPKQMVTKHKQPDQPSGAGAAKKAKKAKVAMLEGFGVDGAQVLLLDESTAIPAPGGEPQLALTNGGSRISYLPPGRDSQYTNTYHAEGAAGAAAVIDLT